MKMKISKLPFITFLKNIKYTCCTVFVICRRMNLKIIHGTKPQIESTVRHATLIRSKRSAYGNGNVQTQSIFLVCTTFSPYEKSQSLALRTNEIPL